MALSPQTIVRLKSQLLTSGVSQKNNPLFQIIDQLIDALRDVMADTATITGTSGGGGGGGITGATYLTEGNETGSLPNSLQVIPGAGIQFNDAYPNRRVISTAIPIGGDGGEDGQDGPPGPPGLPGVAGAIGPAGSNAISFFYAIDAEDGIDGQPGPSGPQGFAGTTGPLGPAGPSGQDGLDGEEGPIGLFPGPAGAAGVAGIAGIQGLIGPSGFDGEDGLDGLIPGPAGPVGDLILTDFTTDLGASDFSGNFDITGLSGLAQGTNVLVVQTKQPISSKGNATDEFEMDPIILTGYVTNATTIHVEWVCKSVAVGTYAFAYALSKAGVQATGFYSTGSWTPTIVSSGGGAPTYSTQTAAYTKIGRLVNANFFMTLATLGTLAAGTITVGGLPFTASADNGVPQLAIFALLNTTWVHVYVVVNPSTSTALIRGIVAAAISNVTNLTVADLTGTSTIAGGLIYTVP